MSINSDTTAFPPVPPKEDGGSPCSRCGHRARDSPWGRESL